MVCENRGNCRAVPGTGADMMKAYDAVRVDQDITTLLERVSLWPARQTSAQDFLRVRQDARRPYQVA